jgi:hypothetical protein
MRFIVCMDHQHNKIRYNEIKTPTRRTITLKILKDIIYSLVHRSTCLGHCCAHHKKPFFHCTCSLCSPCDVRFDVASSLVQVLVVMLSAYAGIPAYTESITNSSGNLVPKIPKLPLHALHVALPS